VTSNRTQITNEYTKAQACQETLPDQRFRPVPMQSICGA
jgi:hypothetical protein